MKGIMIQGTASNVGKSLLALFTDGVRWILSIFSVIPYVDHMIEGEDFLSDDVHLSIDTKKRHGSML